MKLWCPISPSTEQILFKYFLNRKIRKNLIKQSKIKLKLDILGQSNDIIEEWFLFCTIMSVDFGGVLENDLRNLQEMIIIFKTHDCILNKESE